ncbi:MAG TPA: DUF2062 domain-containing protein [Terracidiphilus sp.]|jgi:uncharacterized protein (DUF2062 family)|nr:DUF2062 domain-containing protein [Terracidiphilus sp.]
MTHWLEKAKTQAAGWLRTGISPRRLALTLALGFAIGCLPVFGIPTALCAVLALTMRLNVPAIQAANYAAMPLQLILMLPFVRLGGWLFGPTQQHAMERSLLHATAVQTFRSSGMVAGQAMGAWLLLAGPAVLVMTMGLTLVLQRVPAVVAVEGNRG